MKLLVTGGAGFIGSAFVRRRLAATDETIVVLDLLTYAWYAVQYETRLERSRPA